MATTIGKLRIILTANAGRFQKTMKRSRKTIATFSKSATRFALKIGGIGTALAALVAGGGLVALIRQASISADRLAKTGDKLGVTTEALAGMRLAAKLTGVDIRKMEMGLQRMTRRVSEAAKDTGEAKDAIKELGLDAKALNKLSPDKMFREVAKAMERVGTQGDRVRLAFKLFDSEGVDLVNTLRLGGDELDRLIGLARKLGTGLSRIDAAKIEMMNDAFTLLREKIDGISTQIAVQLAPFIVSVADAVFNVGSESQITAQAISSAFGKMAKFIVSQFAFVEFNITRVWLSIFKMARKGINDIFTLATVFTSFPGGGLAVKLLKPIEGFAMANAEALRDLEIQLGGLEQTIFKKYQELINKIGDKILDFDARARVRLPAISTSGIDRLAAIGAGSTVRGRTGREGLIRAGGTVGAQKLSDSQNQIAKNTKDAAIGIRELLRRFDSTGFPMHMGA